MLLAQLSAGFQLLPLLPTSKLGSSGADSWVDGFVYIPVCLSNELSCEAGSFSCRLNPHRFLQSEVLRLYFTTLEPWVTWSVLLHSYSSQFIHTQMWDCLLCQLLPRPVCQPPPCCESSLPGFLTLPLLPVWINVSSLIPWLSDFHTVQ